MQTKNPKVLNIDWLQLNCYRDFPLDAVISALYTLKPLDYGTRHFKKVTEVYERKERIATIAYQPSSKILNPKMHLIKFDNKQLYRNDLEKYIHQFLLHFNFEFKNISRIDLALDFTIFDNDTLPIDFVRRVVSGQYLKSNKATITNTFTQDIKNTHSYLKFGTNQSEITYYLYDKTKEMNEVKLKPWIQQTWIDNKIDLTKNVWRLEFSIKAPQKNLVNLDTGEFKNPFDLTIIKRPNFNFVYMALVTTYFSFKFKNKQRNKSRMHNIKLFTELSTEQVLKPISCKKDSTRADKIFIKKLNQVNDEMRGTDFNLSIASDDILNLFITERNLTTWAMRKGFAPNSAPK